ncbi:glucosaminidase domain-containing protein [Aestuariivivens insulae]|uniref:glucosaminidase domain-containing protein n=1 Tax=Aestuariivivens insulae TaxID=1621988 RepID=UPI001F583C44|nr:glucosaminidase domain-containing protein [Aestuariivivens insulae]
MQRIIALCFICLLVFSCGSKKRAVAKKPTIERKTRTTSPPDVKETTEATEAPIATKTYASATEQYIDTYKDIAKTEMELYGIPASITLAQGILESGSGKGRLSVEANNHFGIKCHDWTGKKIYHDDDRRQECFRKYKDAKYSFRDHSLFLTQRKRYSALFDLKKHDYRGWAKGLRAAGYATDKKYPQKLISLIERYKLYEYDKGILGEEVVANDERSTPTKMSHTVVKGDTLYSISKKYNTTVEAIRRMNGLEDNIISIGQTLLVQ